MNKSQFAVQVQTKVNSYKVGIMTDNEFYNEICILIDGVEE